MNWDQVTCLQHLHFEHMGPHQLLQNSAWKWLCLWTQRFHTEGLHVKARVPSLAACTAMPVAIQTL